MVTFIHRAASGLSRLLAVIAIALAGSTWAPVAAAQQEGWAVCAGEGQLCQISGDAMVRYGVDGKYVFRNTNASLPCTVESFGSDPVIGKRKQCEVSTTWRSESRYRWWRDAGQESVGVGRGGSTEAPTWRTCASEGGVCEFAGDAKVRYGANGRYITLTGNQRLECSVRAFGGDPTPGTRKTCEVEATGPTWVHCANEGGQCYLPGATQVRYGANGRYAERNADRSIACNSSQFGDPSPGLAKQCEYKTAVGMVAAVIDSGLTTLNWESCGREGERCNFRGASIVRYGVSGRYVYREANNGMLCSVDEFGGDPAFGVNKQCEVLRLKR
jgi:hypothetical protein